MDLRKVKKLIELLEESNLNEMEIREGEESIRLSRGLSPPQQGPTSASMPESYHPPNPRQTGHDGPAPAHQASDIPGGHHINSPMVGTYYEAPEPGAEPYVSIGSKVQAGDTLCVIEAMKIFNQIESDQSGTVVHIQKENGEAVEFGELLFVIQ